MYFKRPHRFLRNIHPGEGGGGVGNVLLYEENVSIIRVKLTEIGWNVQTYIATN